MRQTPARAYFWVWPREMVVCLWLTLAASVSNQHRGAVWVASAKKRCAALSWLIAPE